MADELRRQVTQAMHAEHMATLELLRQLERAIAASNDSAPLDASQPAMRELLHALLSNLEHEVTRHFDFEERKLFPVLEAGGKGELAGILRHEHGAIRAYTPKLLKIARRALAKGLAADEWGSFRHYAMALIAHHDSHMQREESEMIPALEALVDAQRDWELWSGYGTV